MALGDNIYKATTEPVGGYQKHPGYLAQSSERGCCPGRKKRIQFSILFFTGLSIFGSVLMLIIGGTGRGEIFVLSLILSLVLMSIGGALIVFYLRMQGRCNLPCWPSRAARLSSTLIGRGEPPRSNTQMTLAEEESGCVRDDATERAKLMEESDSLEAEKIGRSEPKIVLMSDGAAVKEEETVMN